MTGLGMVAAAVLAVAVAAAVLAIALPGTPGVAMHRRRPEQPVDTGLFTGVSGAIGQLLQQRESRFTLLELSGVQLRPQDLVVRSVVLGIVVTVLGAVFGGWLGALAAAVLTPLGVWGWLRLRLAARRKAFGAQLDDTVQLLAGSLRAGHSINSGFAFVAAEAEEPTATELGRVVNQTRMGRDVTAALAETHRRMENDDFGWIAQAIAINREVGGNLAEVLDGVGDTIRERGALRRQVQALSAEGRMSAIVLMLLPVVVIGLLSVTNPGYLAVLGTNVLGWAMIAAAVVLFVAGALWLRAATRIEF